MKRPAKSVHRIFILEWVCTMGPLLLALHPATQRTEPARLIEHMESSALEDDAGFLWK